MKINKKDLIKYVIIGVIILSVFIVIIVLLGKNKEKNNINLNEVSNNHEVDDSMVMTLYERYNPEKELLFNLVGSDNNKDYYGYFYKNNINYEDLDDTVKNTILFNDADYKTGKYDEENNCYYMSKDSFKIIYEKIYGQKDYNLEFNNDYNIEIIVDSDNICIGDNNNSYYNNYTKIIDTYMVNAINKEGSIVVYERVAFIKIEDDYIYFYKDYKMKDLVYKLKITNDVDMSFINNEKIVSNVLVKYQDDFDLYEYTYKEGVDSYYFESIKK